MDPRMKEKGIPVQPENGFQIRNPWIPLTPGKPVVSRSNGIAIEINGNQLERKNWSEFFELLERKSKQRPNSNRTGNNYDLHEPLTQSSGSYSTTDHQMEIGNSRGGNNFDLTGQMNQHFSSNGTGNDRGTRIMQDGNNYNLNEPLNKSSSLYNMEAHRMGNGILRGGNNFNLAGPLNQISISNGTSNHTRNGFIQGCSNPKFAGQLNQISSSNTRSDHQMGNRFLQGSNNYNPTGRMNQISSSKVTDNHLRNGIIHGGNDSKFIGQLNQISSNTMGNRQMEHRIFQGGDNYSITGRMNQNSSSNITGDHISHEVMLGGNNFNFTGMLNQISSSKSVVDHRMRNENLGNYLKSETQTFQDDILSLRNSPMASNRLIGNTIMIPKANSVISSPLLNLNRQPLSSPRVMNSHNASLIQNYYSEVDNSWTEGNFTSLLLGDEIPDPGPNNNWLNARNSTQMLTDGFHVPALHDNILNTPAMRDIDAGARNANSFPSAPITPDHANMLEKHQQSEMLKFSVDDGSCQEHDKMENLLSSIGNKAIENHCSQVLETIVSPSSTVVTTPQAENKIIDEKGDQDVIDLNETPKQKTPKRRKHRPKVVREGKPKTAPKTKTPKNDELEKDLSKKRKYVRKNKDPEVENATPQETDASIDVPTREESCKKRLNFDFEKAEKAHHQGSQPVLDLNLNYPANQMESHAPTAPSKVINYNTSIVIAKKNSKRNNENRENQNSQEDLNKNISRANIFLERSRMMRWKSTHQMVERDVGNFKGFCGSNGEDHHPNEHVGPPSMCQEPILSKNQETLSTTVRNASEETRKKQKTENDFQTMLCGPEKEHLTNGTCDESTSNAENNMQRKLTILNQEMTLKRMSCRSTQSATTSKNADLSAYQLGREKYEASMQNNGLKIAPNPCRVISFCSNEVPLQERKDTSHPYRQPSIKVKAQPKQMKYSKKTVEEITYRLQSLTISGENGETDAKDIFALLPYEGGGAIIQYEPKKRNPRPKVDLDAETARLWKLLMGKEGSEASEAENKDKEKWWEEERRVFHGRAESFIARMHLVQGDRRFSPWKGSVVDSIIGVFLTQNVSDQLSSSAFMALAAQFPLCSTTADQTSDQSGTSILTEEPEIQLNTGCFEKIMRQPLDSQTSEIYLGSLGTGIMGLETDSFVHHFNVEIQSSSGSSSEAEDSINGGKYVNNIGLANIQHVNRTAPLHALRNPENEHLKQKQGPDQFNILNSFSLLHYPIDSSITNMQKSVLPPNYFQMLMASQVARSEINYEISREEYRSSFPSSTPEMTKEKHIGYWDNRVGQAAAETTSNTLSQQNRLQNNQTPNMDSFPFLTKHLSSGQQVPQIGNDTHSPNTHHVERPTGPVIKRKNDSINQVPNVSKHTGQALDIQEGTTAVNKQVSLGERPNDGHAKGQDCFSGETNTKISAKSLNTSQNNEKEKKESFDWDSLRKMVQSKGGEKERSVDASDSMDYEAMRCSDVNVISNSIRMRGMNHMLAERIKDFLNRVVTDHGGIDLEWLRDVPPDKSKDYLLSIRGLGLKSVECVRLLTLHHLAFPVDTNVGRIAVRLGWVPLQPLPESLQLHLLEMYPVLETVQKYLWPRLCKLDQKTLYELHYQLITFGKVFCTKSKPNCNACPMRGECRHFASAFASARLALPAPEEKGIVGSTTPIITDRRADVAIKHMLLQPSSSNGERDLVVNSCEPIIEEPATPEPGFTEITEADIEDAFYEDPDEIPTIRLNVEQLAVNLRTFMEEHTDLQEGDMSKALVALTPEVASIPVPKLKYVLRLRTERQVYVLTDTHPLVKGLDKREPDDPSPYLLALLAPGEEASSGQLSGKRCESKGSEEMCNGKDCCSTTDGEANSLTVRGTLLIPCRTATRGSFPLNGTYFQVNEVFADHESSLNPIDVPRAWLWHLETRTVFFGTSATSIFRGMTRKEIQNSFWRGFVCVRGFDRKTRAPRPLNRNLHLAQSKTLKISNAAL